MFYVYVNKRKQRVLITRERIADPSWRLAGVHRSADSAKRHARFIADARDYVLEWDILASASASSTPRGGGSRRRQEG
ncbi:hypothetical protein [Pyrobaculum neutrophilum]|uniref:hypothetical protein n=1 Tax=Pyrobaculum neutrophilum TaxID=70771 RepID=UPI00016181A1|nr:hypothetical protein [Pyrobaculum neutrophilum]